MGNPRALPGNYTVSVGIDVLHNQRAIVLLNLFSIMLLFPMGALFFAVASHIAEVRRVAPETDVSLEHLALNGIAIVGVLALHELIHGACFRLYGHPPIFGFKNGFLFAGAPGGFFRRNEYLVMVLAPLLLLSLLGVGLLWFLPGSVTITIVAALVLNGAGSAGDLAMAALLLRYPAHAYVEDRHEGMRVHLPSTPTTVLPSSS